MALTDGVNSSTLQFVVNALRTMNGPNQNLDLTSIAARIRFGTTSEMLRGSGRNTVRNGDGTALTIAQIATAANLTTAQVQDIAGRINGGI